MELKMLADDGDVLRLEVVGRIIQNEMTLTLKVMDDLLGTRGYNRKVLLSLAETRFIDSSGLSWLVVCHKRFCQSGGRLVLHSIAPTVMQLFELMRLDLALHVAPDEAAALESVRRESP